MSKKVAGGGHTIPLAGQAVLVGGDENKGKLPERACGTRTGAHAGITCMGQPGVAYRPPRLCPRVTSHGGPNWALARCMSPRGLDGWKNGKEGLGKKKVG